MMLFFLITSLCAAAFHFVLAPTSPDTVIGASGGISGLFDAVLVMLHAQGMLPAGRFGIWPFAALWIGLSFIFGIMGGPDGSTIAWAAHIGGFCAGLILIKPFMRRFT
jgi:membrane associated rhomboid family serine protease